VGYVPTGDKLAAVVGGGGVKVPPLAPSLVALLGGMAARAEAIDPDLAENIRSGLEAVKNRAGQEVTKVTDKDHKTEGDL
jgi:hypothetical protein